MLHYNKPNKNTMTYQSLFKCAVDYIFSNRKKVNILRTLSKKKRSTMITIMILK